LAAYLLTPPDPPAPLTWPAVFGNPNPVEIEIGFGKGAFLVASAEQRPAVNFLGIEVDRGLQLYVATRVAKRALANVRLARADAREFLRGCVGAGTVQAVHVYFPDPWWKTRHHKRRVFTAAFAAACQRALVPDGRLCIATDVEAYFGVMTQVLAEATRLRPVAEAEGPGVVTNFERKAREQGRPVWRAVYGNQAAPAP
jgi:tRNA (guanine-N7-)-methyltransferase